MTWYDSLMVARSRDLPDFGEPPVVEVALSVQFEPVSTLRAPQLGVLWTTEFRDRFPNTQDHAPLDAVVEQFGGPRPAHVDVRFEVQPPMPRCWFLNPEGTELVQIQQDRFVRNWRKVGGGEKYPRYERIRESFQSDLARFAAFLARENLGGLRLNQCEVTYVNHIPACDAWRSHGEMDRVVRLAAHHQTAFLPRAESTQLSTRYVIGGADGISIGRLHVNVQPAFRAQDQQPLFVLTMTARGRPDGQAVQDAFAFLDRGREWIVRGFAEITTDAMHKVWRRLDA